MKKNSIIVLITVLFVITINACKKNVTSIEAADDGIIGILISGTWQLRSATYFNDSGKVTNTYVGSTADSVLFLFGPDQYFQTLIYNVHP